MVFKELEIQGFKSFPDKVKITFDEGVTGVVGPNGSGKSNLSDAVRRHPPPGSHGLCTGAPDAGQQRPHP